MVDELELNRYEVERDQLQEVNKGLVHKSKNVGVLDQTLLSPHSRQMTPKCDSSNCGLCQLLESSLEGNWDELDTETVTLMDVLERLSRILAEKASHLINKKRSEDNASLAHGPHGPLTSLKASGLSVKKVENR